MEICKTEVPEQKEIEPGHFVVCHLYDDVKAAVEATKPENKVTEEAN
jgi:hypothetical protein